MDSLVNTQAADGVSLGAVPTLQDNQVSLGIPSNVPVSDEVATQRAAKIQEGIGDRIPQKSADEIKQEILSGREQQMRNIAASDLNVERTKQKMNMLSQLAVQKGAPLDENEVQRVMDPFNPSNKPIDPDSVVESQYATRYISSIQDAINAVPNNPVQEAQQEIPEQVDAAQHKASIITAKMEVANTLQENAGSDFHNQSLLSKGWDITKTFWQPYSEYEMRGNVPGVGTFTGGLLLGTNMQEQADRIVAIPDIGEYTQALKKAIEPLTPIMKIRFLDYVKGVPATDRYLDNAFTILAPLDYAAIGKAGVGVARKIDMYNRTNIAMRTLVQNADKVGADAAARAEVTGNLDGAAAAKSTDIALQNLQGTGDPLKVATNDTLLTLHNQDRDAIAASPGNLNREQVTRIQDQYDAAGQGLIQRILDAARINRIPMALATRNAINIIRDTAKDYYAGIRNAILDVSDPLYEPKSNTYWLETSFGNHDGTLFSNPQTAKNFAKQYGMDDVRVVEGTGPITNPQTQALLDQRVAIQKNIDAADQAIQDNKSILADKTTTDEQKATATKQAKDLVSNKKDYEKALNEIELRLEGDAKYNRVTSLQSDVALAKAYNKDALGHLVKGRPPLTAEDRQILKDSVAANQERIESHQQELRAIKAGRASVIGSNATTVQQHGVGFKIVARRPLVETDRAVRDLLIRDPVTKELIPDAVSTSSSTGFKSLFNAAIGKFRGADDTLALNESIQRKIGTYTQSLFREWAHQEAQYIRQIANGVIRKDPITGEAIPYWKAKPTALWNKINGTGHKNYNEFARTLDYARGATDPDTGKPGYFFETPSELQNHYQTVYGRDPSYAEHEGYFAFKRMVEGDRIMREISEFRNRARLGVEQFQLSMRKAGDPIKSDWFDGRSLKNFPGGDDVLMIHGKRAGEERVVNLGGAGLHPKQIEEYREGVKTGKYRVIEVYAPEYKPLRNYSDVVGNEHVRYILTETANSKPIEFNHVNRRGGGHFEYDYDHFLKQANIYHQYENVNGVRSKYKAVYQGDTTFMPLLNRVMGKDIANKLHEVQRLLRAGDIEGAKNFTQANLPIEFDKLHGMFKPGRDALGKETSPQLDLHEPFVVVPNGKSVKDVDNGLEKRYGTSFKDAAKGGSLNKQFQVAYNTERESYGITHLDDAGTQGNPLYKYAPNAKMIDPITTMNRALNRITNTSFMDDYKIYAVEHWLREAEDHLEPIRAEVARSSPFWVFNSANDKTAFRGGTSPDIIRNLLSNRFKIQQFVGIPNKVDTAIHTVKQYLIDTFYQKFGPEESRNIAQKAVVSSAMLITRIKDPVTFLRSMTFHEKLGLFNPAQLLVQAQTFATILSVSPLQGARGTVATMLHLWGNMNHNPEIIRSLDNLATKMGWRPGEFTEARQALAKTGFEKVAGEYADLNTALKTDFVGNDFKNFLNAGTWFFRQGEKSTRLGAWYTAFGEFRKANPTGAISKSDLGKILQRADLLSGNMSRASASVLHSGVMSMTTQFLTYQLRLAELFMGTRLGGTTTERMMARLRMVTFYAALYGAPSAVGLTGAPMADSIRKEAIQRGYTIGNNWLKTAMAEGLPAMFANYITGGNNYNIGPRYGSPGFTQLQDFLKSDTPWWSILGGASGTTLTNQLTAQSNFWHAMAAMAFGRNETKPFPLKMEDFVDMFKEVSSFNQAWKLYMAINTGKWMSKNEGYVGDVTKWNAMFMALTGLSPQEQEDAFLKSGIRAGEVEMQKYILKEFIKLQQRGYQNAHDGNYTAAADNHRRAQTLLELGGFPTDKIGQAYAIATRGYESMVKDEDYSFAFKDVPQSRSDFLGIPMPFTTQSNLPETRREQFRTQQQINNMSGK